MHVRYPNLDFSDIHPHWAPNKEFAQSYNAFSLVPAYIEPYLVKVMKKVQQKLDPVADKDLMPDVDVFIKQEVQHCKQHIKFNNRMHEFYPGMVEIEQEYEADYIRFYREKSLKFNCAYAEGFEAMGSIAAQFIFTQLDDLFEGADPRAVNLWKWHLAEEFEHRCVAYNVYKSLFGKGLFRGYFGRVYGALYAVKHIRAYTKRMAEHLLAEDRKNMTPQEVEASKARAAIYSERVKAFNKPRMLKVLLPFYNPAHKSIPAGLQAYLTQFDTPKAA